MKNQSFLKRLGFAIHGIRSAYKNEASFRFQIRAAFGVLALLLVLQPEPLWWAILSLTVGAVLTAELLNTALESFMDRLHPEIHESIRLAKDCAAGAVWIASLMSILVLIALLLDVISINRS